MPIYFSTFKIKLYNTNTIHKEKQKRMTNKVPSSLKHNIWIKYIGETFHGKCNVEWCANKITPFTFEAGHNIPYSKGGCTTIDNLRPICSECNKSMGNRYTIDEFSEKFRTSDITIIDVTNMPNTPQPNTNIPIKKKSFGEKLLNIFFPCR